MLLISDVFEFSWRYQLPALVMLPPAGVLGGWAAWRVFAARRRVARRDAGRAGSACPLAVAPQTV